MKSQDANYYADQINSFTASNATAKKGELTVHDEAGDTFRTRDENEADALYREASRKSHPGRGGKREGPGRPVGTTKPKAERKTTPLPVRMTPAERKKAERIGNGNASAGMRRALAVYSD